MKSNHLSKCHASILKQFVLLPVSDLLGANLRQPDIFIYFWAHFVSANRLSHKTMHHFYLNVKDTLRTLKKISAGSRIRYIWFSPSYTGLEKDSLILCLVFLSDYIPVSQVD